MCPKPNSYLYLNKLYTCTLTLANHNPNPQVLVDRAVQPPLSLIQFFPLFFQKFIIVINPSYMSQVEK